MATKISVVINTFNEEKNIERAVNSVKWADEIIVCDMNSQDQTVIIAGKLGAKVFLHEQTNYVEPARNFAISKAKNNWILVLDADEEVSNDLRLALEKIAEEDAADFVEIPRKNIIFGKWIRNAQWWPDYHIRLFKRGKVVWKDEIHSKPKTHGQLLTLAEKEDCALIHHNYQNIQQFLDRMSRYTTIQAYELNSSGYQFEWRDLIIKPLSEFLGRFFANKGFEDGVHGLILCLLQAFSELVLYIKVWEKQGMKDQMIKKDSLEKIFETTAQQVNYWLKETKISKSLFGRFLRN